MHHPYIIGEKLYLRAIERKDLSGSFFQWMHEEPVTRYMSMGVRPNILENLEDWFETLRKSEEEIVLMIIDKESDKEIGSCGLYRMRYIPRSAEYRIFIGNRQFWNKGYGEEATKLVIRYAFEKLNLNKVWLGVNMDNAGAVRLYEKCGFVREGILRQEVYRNSRYYDAVRMSILRTEYYQDLKPGYDTRRKKLMIPKETTQATLWQGEFGKEYTDGHISTVEEMDRQSAESWGVSRTEMNSRFLKGIEHSTWILEVGCSVGNQLLCLQKMGFDNLYGIEIQDYAVEVSKSGIREVSIIQGSALDIPFRNFFFDLVFTSGLLVHIPPDDIGKALDEIYRCTKSYIWGFEYYAEEYQEIKWKRSKMLWKTDFVKLYQERFPDLELVEEQRFQYRKKGTHMSPVSMFLVKKP